MFLFGALIALPNYLTLLPMHYPGTDSHNTAVVWRNFPNGFGNHKYAMGETLQTSLKTRCIHPGANTLQITVHVVYVNRYNQGLYRVVV
jgi:hypothetical protein